MKIVALEAANIKALRAVAIIPNGNVIQITGENEAGKSSVIDSIFFAFAGKKALPSHPVRRGQQTAYIHLDLGTLRVTRRFSVDGKTDLIVEAESGAQFRSPQAVLDGLMGELTFDPLKFALAEPKSQLETLRGLVKLDVDVDALDRQNDRDYELRREWNRKVSSLKERVSTLASGIDEFMSTTVVDIEALTAQMAEASEHNAAIDRRRVRRENTQASIESARKLAQDKRDEARRLQDEADALEKQADADATLFAKAEALPDPIDVTALRAQISEAMKANTLAEQQGRQRAAYAAASADLAEATAYSRNLTEAMDARTVERQAAIANAKMPVDGLGFGDGEVLYNDLPFSQASQGVRIRVSFAVAVAMNPKLRVVLIRDASLLDEKNLALIAQMAEEKDFQVFLERVDSTAKIGIHIEDGQVAAIDGVRVDSPMEPEPV